MNKNLKDQTKSGPSDDKVKQRGYLKSQLMKSGSKTQGYLALKNFFADVQKREAFRATIATLRKKWGLPKEGFGLEESAKTESASFIHSLGGRQFSELVTEIDALCNQFELHPPTYGVMVRNIFLYGQVVHHNDLRQNLILVEDSGKIAILSREHERMWDNHYYPILLRISPYASKRDILDFVDRCYITALKPLQNNYKKPEVKIKKIKKTDAATQERNEFIYQNRQLPRKELMKLGIKKFSMNFPDHGAVSKIISLEKKRREEV